MSQRAASKIQPIIQDKPIPAWPGWLTAFALAGVVYVLTASRGAQWQDSGSQILRIVTGTLAEPRGLALVHPLHHWLGRLAVYFGPSRPSLSITLLSGLAAAVAVANVYGCVLTLTRRRTAAALAAASLAVAHTFWQLATLTETYTLTTALLSGECWCLVYYSITRRRSALWGLFLLNGLGIANHMQAVLMLPVLVFVLIHELRKKRAATLDAVIAIALWLICSLPYTVLVVSTWLRSGDLSGTMCSALFGEYYVHEVLSVSPSARGLLVVFAFVTLCFPNLTLPAAGYGLVCLRRLSIPVMARRGLVTALLLHAVFALRYNVVDQHMFMLPTYVLMSIFCGVGYAAAMQSWPKTRLRVAVSAAVAMLVLTPVWYRAVPGVARERNVLRGVERNKPYRDDYVYLFTPWSFVERSADRMGRHAVELAGEDGIILVEDSMAEPAIRYRVFRDERERIGVTRDPMADEVLAALAANRAVVLVPLNRDQPQLRIPGRTWERVGDLYVAR